MKRKLLTETPVCPRERLVIIIYTIGLSFAQERIGPLAAIIITVFYLLALYLLILPNTSENPFASIYCESLIKTTYQHLLLLVGFDTLIYRKYYDIPHILVGHQLHVPMRCYALGLWSSQAVTYMSAVSSYVLGSCYTPLLAGANRSRLGAVAEWAEPIRSNK
jgi:hypothetical protein